jgi:hypothetical protein
MAHHVWSVLCARALLDRATNSVTLVDALERIEVSASDPDNLVGKLTLSQPFVLVSLWTRADPSVPETARARFTVVVPTGEQASQNELALNLEQHPRTRTFLNFPAFPMKGPGTYVINVECLYENEWQFVASVPLEIAIDTAITPSTGALATTGGTPEVSQGRRPERRIVS